MVQVLIVCEFVFSLFTFGCVVCFVAVNSVGQVVLLFLLFCFRFRLSWLGFHGCFLFCRCLLGAGLVGF